MRSFLWWFGMGSLTTLSVLMVQGGVRDLLYETHPSGSTSAYLSFFLTIFGGGLLAGSLAVILNRLR
ncbi:hypothetical protein YTPLAS18_03320 [Nitrospira sp.]|nr:hypothetical protein YTPLAS18_03320 [Nitrospira sp.]